MRYPQVVNLMTSSPWLITNEGMQTILDIMNERLEGRIPTKEEVRERMGGLAGRDRDSYSSQFGNVGILSLEGPMFPRANLLTELSGATSIEQARQEFHSMLGDPKIGSILLSFDTPGGSSQGIAEFARDIFDARDSGKRIVSIANMDANSAGYYLASQASEMYATPSGTVGSIGVFAVLRDISGAQEKMGVKEHVVTAGRLKHIGHVPPSEEDKAVVQDFVNETYEQFVSAVARGRSTTNEKVISDFGEGMIVHPNTALKSGMIDGVATFDEVVQDMSTSNERGAYTGSNTTAASARVTTNLSYDADKEHSEPGTGQGGEPTPREAPEKDDPAIKGGWRRDPPPIAFEEEERSVMNREQLENLAGLLSIEFNAEMSDEDLAAQVVEETRDVVTPIVQASSAAEQDRNFERDYPEQAARIAELESDRRSKASLEFASKFERFEGSTKGFSTLVREMIQSAHVGITERTFTHDDLEKLLTAAASDTGIVEYDERGSSRQLESVSVAAGADRQTTRKLYADEIHRLMKEDNLDRKAAQRFIAENNPQLAAAYIGS